MPEICEETLYEILYEINELYHDYNTLPWYKKLFYPRSLGQALQQYQLSETKTIKLVDSVYQTFLNRTWWFQRLFFSSLFDFSVSSRIDALKNCAKTGLLSGESGQANREAIISHKEPEELAFALRTLNDANLLIGESGQANCQAIINQEHPNGVANAVQILNDANLLIGESDKANCQAIISHKKPYELAFALRTLNNANLLIGESGQANCQAIINHEYPSRIVSALRILNNANLLIGESGQANIDNLLANSAILLGGEGENVWDRIPWYDLFTRPIFHRMIAIAREYQHNPFMGQRALMAFVTHAILGGEVDNEINEKQSTHTSSVHVSVSASAVELLSCYGNQLSSTKDLNKIIKCITAWMGSIPQDTLKEQAANRCLKQLVSASYHDYVDNKSKVSILQLLAMFWLAISDNIPNADTDDKKKATEFKEGFLKARKELLIEGLYEIQRGYNLSSDGVDKGDDDNPICSGGTFNKLMEKLVGIHPKVKVIFVTKQTAMLRFFRLANDEVVKQLNSLDENELHMIITQDSGLSDGLWNRISKTVSDLLLEEFGSLYEDDPSKFEEQLLINRDCIELPEATRTLAANILNSSSVTSSSSSSSFFQSKAIYGEPVTDEEEEEQVRDYQH